MLQRQKANMQSETTAKDNLNARRREWGVKSRIQPSFPCSRLKGGNSRVPFNKGELIKVELEVAALADKLSMR